jgi:transposase-like protein
LPQTRGVEFYPTALDRGERSERALKLALAEMYVQGVTTRKVSAVMQKHCGLDVTSSQASRVARALDAELVQMQPRPFVLRLDVVFRKLQSLQDCPLELQRKW